MTVAVPLIVLSRVEVAVMVAVPAVTPVTTPLLTVAMLLLLLDQVTSFDPESTLTFRVTVPPMAIEEVDGLKVIALGASPYDEQMD